MECNDLGCIYSSVKRASQNIDLDNTKISYSKDVFENRKSFRILISAILTI